jgi:uncharacterized integral membrane protein
MWSLFERMRRWSRNHNTDTRNRTGAPDRDTGPSRHTAIRTRTGGTWVATLVSVITVVLVLIFVMQNLVPTTVRFFGISGSVPVGLAMLFAALAGALLIALPGTARIVQLRRSARHRHQ